ncbi:MAG: InlB B-repeat-containing protein [Clostridia bacterium]|nr:InlB B-repeat-containing protein [Clostridia bacterium]
MLESILGESYTLTIQGNRNLTLNPIDYGISVKNFVSTSTGSLTINHDTVGINSLGTVTITGTTVNLVLPEADNRRNPHIGIRAEGDISINAAISIPNSGEFTNYASNSIGVYSENGNISVTGSFSGTCRSAALYANSGSLIMGGNVDVTKGGNGIAAIYASGDITFHGASLRTSTGSILSAHGNVEVAADEFTSRTVTALDVPEGNITLKGSCVLGWQGTSEMTGTEITTGGTVTLTGGRLVIKNNRCIEAGGDINLVGDVDIAAIDQDCGRYGIEPAGTAIHSANGNIRLAGATSRVYGDNAIDAPNGTVFLFGNVEVGAKSPQTAYAIFAKTAIQSECTRITKTGPAYAAGGYYYTANFSAEGTEAAIPSQFRYQGGQVTMPAFPYQAPENFEFTGWSNAAHPNLNVGDAVVINSDSIFYAQWRRIPRTVTFSANGGSGTMESLTVGQGEQLTLPECGFTPPSADYSFDRWQIGGALYNPGSTVTITGNTTISAVWLSDVVHVTFEANGGTGSMDGTNLMKGGLFTLPECGFTPPLGQAFVYWNATGYHEPGAVITVLKDITVKPVWRAAKISFDANGGSGAMDPVVVQASANGVYTFPDCAFTPPANKSFAGWQVDDLVRMPGDSLTIYGDKNAHARWADTVYTVSFMHGGGSGTMSSVQATSGSVFTFPVCTFTPPSGKEFSGWLYAGTVYPAGSTITVFNDMGLYAQWRTPADAVYTITFDGGDGGTGSMPSISVVNGDSVTLPECGFVREGYSFRYWNLGAAYGYYKFAGAAITLKSNVTATAIWDKIPVYEVTFATDGTYQGTLPEAQSLLSGTPAREPEPLEMDGYAFLGWFDGRTTDEQFRWDFSVPVTSNKTLYCGFMELPKPIAVTTDGHGSAAVKDINGNPIEAQTKGNWVFLTVTPDPGYELSYITWQTAGGQANSITSSKRFTMPDQAVAVTVIFRPVRVNFILPASLTAIEDEAFSGLPVTKIVIPGSVTSITGDPFAGSAVTAVYGFPGSAAKTFCDTHPAYTFVAIDDEWMAGQ